MHGACLALLPKFHIRHIWRRCTCLPALPQVFVGLYHHFLGLSDWQLALLRYDVGAGDAEAERHATQLLCVRAMATIYHVHAGASPARNFLRHCILPHLCVHLVPLAAYLPPRWLSCNDENMKH